MAAIVLDGKALARELEQQLAVRVAALKQKAKGVTPFDIGTSKGHLALHMLTGIEQATWASGRRPPAVPIHPGELAIARGRACRAVVLWTVADAVARAEMFGLLEPPDQPA